VTEFIDVFGQNNSYVDEVQATVNYNINKDLTNRVIILYLRTGRFSNAGKMLLRKPILSLFAGVCPAML